MKSQFQKISANAVGLSFVSVTHGWTGEPDQVTEAFKALTRLSPERTAEIRRRILEGIYTSVEIAGEVARRMIERGDM